MSRLGIFACLLMLVAVAVCVEMPNMKPPELPKDAGQGLDGTRRDPQMPTRPEGPNPDGPRTDGRPELPKSETPKPDAKGPQGGKS